MGHRKFKPRGAKAQPLGLNGLIWFGLGGIILLGLIGFTFFGRGGKTSPSFTPEAADGAKLKADREYVDLGNVQLGQTVSVAFELTNVGDKPLQFTEQPYIEVVEGC